MRKKAIVAIALLTALFVYGITASPTTAADYTRIGVKSGDNATYAFSVVNSTVNLYGTVRVNVTEVTGTIATLSLAYYNPDGSANTTITLGPYNVSTGEGGIGTFLICANLTKPDRVNLGAPATINDTMDMVAAGITRTVNHLNFTSAATRVNIWWDKLTGLMVKITIVGPSVSPGLGNFTMTSTSLWSPPGGPLIPTEILIIGVGVIIVVAAAAMVLHRRGK